MKIGLCLAVMTSFVFTSSACGISASPEIPAGPNGEIDPELAIGRTAWSKHCSNCHGSAGQGGRGKQLNNGEIFKLYPENDALLGVISKGKGQSMPGFQSTLSPKEINAVSRYIREILN